jgi:hypothetical protein
VHCCAWLKFRERPSEDLHVEMVSSDGLIPIVMGIGLAALSGGTLAAARSSESESRWREPLFVFAVLLIGLPVFGAALYELGWSIESGHKLARSDARAENWLIVALALLLVALAARTAWIGYFHSPRALPWERGYLDRWPQLLGFAIATLAALLVGVIVVEILLVASKSEASSIIPIVAVTIAAGLLLAWALLRLMTGGNPSPTAHARTRRQQLKLMASIEGSPGAWTGVEISAVGDVQPALALSVVVLMTPQGLYYRPDDGHALVRYHDWVANHLVVPTPAVHAQRLMVANPARQTERHLVIRPWTGRRAAWLDVLRMNRGDRRTSGEPSSAAQAGLVHMPYPLLAAAGLRLTIK